MDNGYFFTSVKQFQERHGIRIRFHHVPVSFNWVNFRNNKSKCSPLINLFCIIFDYIIFEIRPWMHGRLRSSYIFRKRIPMLQGMPLRKIRIENHRGCLNSFHSETPEWADFPYPTCIRYLLRLDLRRPISNFSFFCPPFWPLSRYEK